MKKLPFDLAKALAGEKLVTRAGEPATDFGHNPEGGTYYPYKFTAGGRTQWAMANGRNLLLNETSDDLFLLDEIDQPAPDFIWANPPCTTTKREYFAACALQGLLANPNVVVSTGDGDEKGWAFIGGADGLTEWSVKIADWQIHELNKDTK